MIEFVKNYFDKELPVLKSAPTTFFTLLVIGFLLSFLVSNWAHQQKIDNLKEQIDLYKTKLEVSNPDEAYAKFQELNEELKLSINSAKIELQNIIDKSNNESFIVNDVWPEPICPHKDDTEKTKRQILVHHLMGQKLGIKAFNDPNFCKEKYP